VTRCGGWSVRSTTRAPSWTIPRNGAWRRRRKLQRWRWWRTHRGPPPIALHARLFTPAATPSPAYVPALSHSLARPASASACCSLRATRAVLDTRDREKAALLRRCDAFSARIASLEAEVRLALGGGALPPGVAALFGGGHDGDGSATADDDGAGSTALGASSSRVDGTFFSLAAAREADTLRAAVSERDNVINALIAQLGAARDAAEAAMSAAAGASAPPPVFVSAPIPPVPAIPSWAPPALRAALAAPPLRVAPAQPQQQIPHQQHQPTAPAASAATAATAAASATAVSSSAAAWEEEKAALLDYLDERTRAEAAQADEVSAGRHRSATPGACGGWSPSCRTLPYIKLPRRPCPIRSADRIAAGSPVSIAISGCIGGDPVRRCTVVVGGAGSGNP
jgi:hypothetical protein